MLRSQLKRGHQQSTAICPGEEGAHPIQISPKVGEIHVLGPEE
jgi:hypothetical protein